MIRLNRRTLSPLHCASKDPTRYSLNALHFDNEGVTVGTNGHILACVRPAELEPHRTSFSLEPAALAAAVRATRPRSAPDVELIPCGLLRNWRVCNVEHSEMDVEYPTWQQAHPVQPPVPQHTVMLSLHVLEALVATARQFAGGKKGDEDTPIAFEFPGAAAAAIRAHTTDKQSGDILEFTVCPRRK